MLYNLDDNPPNRDAHEADFQAWRSRISDADYQAMVDAINAYCDQHQEGFRSSWMPGQDSAIDAAFPPLTAACGGSREGSGMFFGNIVWRVIIDRDDNWYFKAVDREGGDPPGMTYWRKRS